MMHDAELEQKSELQFWVDVFPHYRDETHHLSVRIQKEPTLHLTLRSVKPCRSL